METTNYLLAIIAAIQFIGLLAFVLEKRMDWTYPNGLLGTVIFATIVFGTFVCVASTIIFGLASLATSYVY